MGVGVVLVHDMDLDLAEAARESDLVAGRQVLVAKQQELVGEEGVVDRRKRRFVDRRHGNAFDLRPQPAFQGTQAKACGVGLTAAAVGTATSSNSAGRVSRVARDDYIVVIPSEARDP